MVVPETFARNSDTLSLDLADNGLHHDLVRRNREPFNCRLNFIGDFLSLVLALLVVILPISQVSGYDLLDEISDL